MTPVDDGVSKFETRTHLVALGGLEQMQLHFLSSFLKATAPWCSLHAYPIPQVGAFNMCWLLWVRSPYGRMQACEFARCQLTTVWRCILIRNATLHLSARPRRCAKAPWSICPWQLAMRRSCGRWALSALCIAMSAQTCCLHRIEPYMGDVCLTSSTFLGVQNPPASFYMPVNHDGTLQSQQLFIAMTYDTATGPLNGPRLSTVGDHPDHLCARRCASAKQGN